MGKWVGKPSVPVFTFREVALAETYNLITSLGGSSALGHEGLDSLGIKDAVKSLALHLESQDADRFSTSSYHPVAVLPAASKLIERATQVQLIDFFEEKNYQLNSSCHAYHKVLGNDDFK